MIKKTFTAQLSKTFPALAHENFRYFWFGQFISLFGTWMQRTAQQWLVYTMTDSAFLLGILGVAQFGPMLIFSLFAGVIADRYPKKRMLLFTQTALMIQAFFLAVLVLSGHVLYWQVLVLATTLGFVNTLDMPVRQSFIIELVGKKDLSNAIALNSSIVNLARIAGPAISALLMAGVGVGYCFLLNGLSFIPAILSLFLIKPMAANNPRTQESMVSSIIGGLRYIISKPILSSSVLAMLAVGTFVMNMDVLIPVFADKVLHQGVQGYGLLLSAMGIGSLVGALLVATKVRSIPSRQTMFASALMISALLISINFIYSYILSTLTVTLIGFFSIVFITTVNSTLQLNSNNEYRGRVMSVYVLAFGGTTPLGNFFAGSLAEKLGPSLAFLMCGVVSGLLIIALILWILFKEHNQDSYSD